MQSVMRFDDVCLRTDLVKLAEMARLCVAEGLNVMIGITPSLCGTEEECGERAFPLRLMPLSDHRVFYDVVAVGVPDVRKAFNGIPCQIVSHGMVHVDHRLLSEETQELSIRMAAALTESRVFVPPFNKWNSTTEKICQREEIELIRFEDGWKHVLYNNYRKPELHISKFPLGRTHDQYYVHPYEMTPEKLGEWFERRDDESR